MTNPNLLSLVVIVASISFITKCNADRSRKLVGDKDFGYTEGALNGPKNWGSVNSGWKTCENGKSQSPINIQVKDAQVQPPDLKRAYKDAPAKLVNGGHDIGIDWQGDAGGIEVMGATYKLVHCHWHIPSEHSVDGKRYDVELHMVHSNDKGQNAVVSFFHTTGPPDPFIQGITEKMKEVSGGGGKQGVDLGNINASIMEGSKKYFRYKGSLTTPPCTEGVIWTVAQNPRPISVDQINLLKGAVPPEYQENARPIQELGGRQVSQFELPEEQVFSILPPNV